jgi:hypothetical protein
MKCDDCGFFGRQQPSILGSLGIVMVGLAKPVRPSVIFAAVEV